MFDLFKPPACCCRKTLICLWCALQQTWIRSLMLLPASTWTMLPVSLTSWKKLVLTVPRSGVFDNQKQTNFRDGKGKVYMTHPTKAVYKFIMQDFLRMRCARHPIFRTILNFHSQLWLNRFSVYSPRFQHVFCFYHNRLCAPTDITLSRFFFHTVPCRTRPRRVHVPHRYCWAQDSLHWRLLP